LERDLTQHSIIGLIDLFTEQVDVNDRVTSACFPMSHSVSSMSALPPKADIPEQSADVRFVPIADILRRSAGKCFCGLEI
jgi:hypothetical protein